MLLVSITFLDRCWSYVLIVTVLFTYSLQLTIDDILLILSRHPSVKYGLCIPWLCCLPCHNSTAKSHPLRRGNGVIDDLGKKMYISIITWGIFRKVGQVFISLCKNCETFSEILCIVWLSAYKKTHSSWNKLHVWRRGLSCKRELILWEKV